MPDLDADLSADSALAPGEARSVAGQETESHLTQPQVTELSEEPQMKGGEAEPAVEEPSHLAVQLERRQDDVIAQLDELNSRIENLIELYSRLRQTEQPEPVKKAA